MDFANELLKIKKAARILRAIIRFIFWLCILGIVISILFLVVNGILPENLFIIQEGNKLGFSLCANGLIRYRIDSIVQKGISVKPIMLSIAFMASVICTYLSLLARQVSALLLSVEKNEPFEINNAKRLYYIGVISIIGAFIYKGAEFFVSYSIINTFHIENIDLVYSADTSLILFGCIMLILSGIFKYGSFLQKEYDSTL